MDHTYFNDSTSTCCKVVFVYLSPSQFGVESGRTYAIIAQMASKYTQTLSGLHGLVDMYSLGIDWNGHRSGLGQYELHNQLRTFFRREKSSFVSSHFTHDLFLYP